MPNIQYNNLKKNLRAITKWLFLRNSVYEGRQQRTWRRKCRPVPGENSSIRKERRKKIAQNRNLIMKCSIIHVAGGRHWQHWPRVLRTTIPPCLPSCGYGIWCTPRVCCIILDVFVLNLARFISWDWPVFISKTPSLAKDATLAGQKPHETTAIFVGGSYGWKDNISIKFLPH